MDDSVPNQPVQNPHFQQYIKFTDNSKPHNYKFSQLLLSERLCISAEKLQKATSALFYRNLYQYHIFFRIRGNTVYNLQVFLHIILKILFFILNTFATCKVETIQYFLIKLGIQWKSSFFTILCHCQSYQNYQRPPP